MEPHEHPLFEFDPNLDALINPRGRFRLGALPERAVICWFGDIVRGRHEGLDVEHRVPYEHGAHPIAVVDHGGVPVALVNAPVGAPAAVGVLEYLIAQGTTKVIGCGGAGVIVSGFDVGHAIVPTSAVRDEGTSYHYAAPGIDVRPHPDGVRAIVETFLERGVPFELGRTWTTDAYFRETPAKILRRREQGCISVEMEASAMFAVAMFRRAVYAQILYAGDDVSAAEWDHRGWDQEVGVRERILDLALAAVVRL